MAKLRKWCLRLFLIFTFFIIVAWFVIPPAVSPWILERVEAEVADSLEARGSIDSLSFSLLGGVELGAGHYVRPDGSLAVTWRRVESDLSPLRVLMAKEPQPLGEKLVVTGVVIEATDDSEGTSGGRTETAEGAQASEVDEEVAQLRYLPGVIEIEVASAKYGDDVLATDAKIRGVCTDGKVEFTLSPTKLNEGTIQGTGVIEGDNWSADFTAEDVVTAGKLIDVLARVSPVFALMNRAPAQVACLVGVPQCSLTGTIEDPEGSLRGQGELAVSAGRVVVPEELKDLLGTLSEKDMERLEFRPYRQKFRIVDGRIENTGFGLSSTAGSLWIEGHTTVDGRLNHTIRLDKIATRDLGVSVSDDMILGLLKNNPVRLVGSVDEPRLILPPALEQISGLLQGVFGRDKGSNGSKKGTDLEDLIRTGLDILRRK